MLSAAKRLGISQSKLSRHLTALEVALGKKLLERNTRGCTLTEDGQALFMAAERVESEFLRVQATFSASEELRGTVRIGAPDGLGSGFLASKLGHIRNQFPNLLVQLVPLPNRFSLSEREVDIAITVGRPERGRLRLRKLTDFSLAFYASQEYLSRRPLPSRIDELVSHDLVGYVKDLIYTPELNYAQEVWADWMPTFEVATAAGQVAAVRAGFGVGLLHEFLVLGDPNLVRILPESKVTRSYWTVWHEDMSGLRRIEAVAKFLDSSAKANRDSFLPAIE